jgi:uncharacterized protein affecting Mg2+/Co2+ transport
VIIESGLKNDDKGKEFTEYTIRLINREKKEIDNFSLRWSEWTEIEDDIKQNLRDEGVIKEQYFVKPSNPFHNKLDQELISKRKQILRKFFNIEDVPDKDLDYQIYYARDKSSRKPLDYERKLSSKTDNDRIRLLFYHLKRWMK